MKEFFGMMIIFTAVNFGCWWIIGHSACTKDKIICSLAFEAFILAVGIGAYLIGG